MPCVIFCHLKNRMDMKNEEVYREMAQEVRRELAQEQERLADKARRLEERMQLMDAMEGLLEENRRQREEMESLQQQLAEEKRQRMEMEMKLKETRQLSDNVAKKSSEDGVVKAISTYVNRSKRKTSDKRAYIKNMILEFVTVNGLSLPEEISTTIECLDDEDVVPKNVTVNGNYIEAHDNKEVTVNK